jgi:hypothetical protein
MCGGGVGRRGVPFVCLEGGGRVWVWVWEEGEGDGEEEEVVC